MYTLLTHINIIPHIRITKNLLPFPCQYCQFKINYIRISTIFSIILYNYDFDSFDLNITCSCYSIIRDSVEECVASRIEESVEPNSKFSRVHCIPWRIINLEKAMNYQLCVKQQEKLGWLPDQENENNELKPASLSFDRWNRVITTSLGLKEPVRHCNFLP